jgi:nucleoside-diphosphate-sugar epimerase
MKHALVIGAVNAVGSRVAEALCDRGVTTVALVDDWVQAARLARLPLRFSEGSPEDAEALARAMVGCDVVFHCAEYDRRVPPAAPTGPRAELAAVWNRLARSVDSAYAAPRRKRRIARAVVDAAVKDGIGRLACLNASGHATAAEHEALRYHGERGLSVTVLRPATLYGPFCPWTIEAICAVRRNRRPSVGREPVLYIDHLVEAMLLAARSDAGSGQSFDLCDPEPASCEELFEAHARAAVGGQVAPAGRRPSRARAEDRMAPRALEYTPKSDFAETMERTAAWIEWSRL